MDCWKYFLNLLNTIKKCWCCSMFGSTANMTLLVNENCQDKHPLLAAVETRDLQTVEALLKAGTVVEVKDDLGRTPLHIAARLNSTLTIKLLIENGAYVDCLDNAKRTPLHLASERRSYGAIVLLLELGANINLVSKENYTAIDYAAGTRDRCDVCLNVLQRHVFSMLAIDNIYLIEELYELGDRYDLLDLQQASRDEFEKSKKTFIGNSTITYYKFLQKNVENLVPYLKNECIWDILSSASYKKEFPYFSTVISSHFYKGKKHLTLYEKVVADSIVIFKVLPIECVEIIVGFLSSSELKKFADCINEIFL